MEKQYSKEQFEDYVKENGYITDEHLAIDLLCKSPFAWYALDESLKENPTIILYYQPLGHAYYLYEEHTSFAAWIWCLQNGVDDEWPTYTVVSKPIPQKGFKIIFEKRDYYQIPDIELPEKFDIELYKKIQNELKGSLPKNPINNIDDFDINGVKKKEHYDKYPRFEIREYYRPCLAGIVGRQIKNEKRRQFV